MTDAIEGTVEDQEPITFILTKRGDAVNVEVPDDSPLNEFPTGLVYLAIGRALRKSADLFIDNASRALEDDEDYDDGYYEDEEDEA